MLTVRAFALLRQGNNAAALRDVLAARDAASSDAEELAGCWENVGGVAHAAGRFQMAVDAFRTAMQYKDSEGEPNRLWFQRRCALGSRLPAAFHGSTLLLLLLTACSLCCRAALPQAGGKAGGGQSGRRQPRPHAAGVQPGGGKAGPVAGHVRCRHPPVHPSHGLCASPCRGGCRRRAVAMLARWVKVALDPALDPCPAASPTEIPPGSQAYLGRSMAYRFKGCLQKAVADATMATHLAPANGDAHAHLGLAYWGLKNYAEARESFALSVRMAPDDEGECRCWVAPGAVPLLRSAGQGGR